MDLVVIFSGILVITVGYQISRAIRARMERSSINPSSLFEVKQHLEQLQQSVDSIAVEVERISEAQRFTAKLLMDRAPDSLGASNSSPT
jgi:hypothetical protein